MKRSKSLFLLFVAAGMLSSCGEERRPNQLRERKDVNGVRLRDEKGNPLYEDDEGQHYTYTGGHFFPWFTLARGFTHIPGTGIAAPAASTPMTAQNITSRKVSVPRGGFGGSGYGRTMNGTGGSNYSSGSSSTYRSGSTYGGGSQMRSGGGFSYGG